MSGYACSTKKPLSTLSDMVTHYWRASEASETLLGVTNGNWSYICGM